MGYTSIILKWASSESVQADYMVITSSGTSNIVKPIAQADLEAMSLPMEGLSSGVTYKAYMGYQGNVVSTITFTTPEKPAGAIEIDNTANLKTVIEDAPAGSTIILAAGQDYNYSNADIYIDKNLTLIGAPGGTAPIVYIRQFRLCNSDMTVDVDIDEVRFAHIDFTGMIYGADFATGKPQNSIIGFGTNGARTMTIDRINLESCTARHCHIAMIMSEYTMDQVDLRIGEINIDDCLIYDMGRQDGGFNSLIHLNSWDGNQKIYCGKYTITNSTIHHTAHGLIEARAGTEQKDNPEYALPQVDISNCTFDNLGVTYPGVYTGTNVSRRSVFTFYNWGPTDAEGVKVNISNSVFGAVGNINLQDSPFAIAMWGTRENSFRSTDTPTEDRWLMLTTKDLTADQIFPDRAQFNYRIADEAAMIGVGDPRWNE